MPDRINEFAASWWADRLDAQHADKQDAFRTSLTTRLGEQTKWKMECDYDPSGVLLEAVREAGIECSGRMWSAKGILPMKTKLVRDEEELRFKEGYGGGWNTIESSWWNTIEFP